MIRTFYSGGVTVTIVPRSTGDLHCTIDDLRDAPVWWACTVKPKAWPPTHELAMEAARTALRRCKQSGTTDVDLTKAAYAEDGSFHVGRLQRLAWPE